MKRTSVYFELRHFVEASEKPEGWWQVIAAFNCEAAAKAYAKLCAHVNAERLEYRVTKRGER